MRIAMLAWESLHSVAVGGIATHVSELAAALQQRGHQIHVFTRMAPGQRYYDWIDGVHYHRCPYPAHDDFVDDINNLCRALVERVYVVEDLIGEFDIIHAHDWLAANAMIWIKQGRARRTVLTIHSTEYARCGNAFWDGQSGRIRYQERAGTYWADRVICVSRAAKDEIVWMYEVPPAKAFVIHNGVNAERFAIDRDLRSLRRRHGIGRTDPTVLFCGRLEWQKGPDLLMEAVPKVLDRFHNAKFIFVGDGSMRPGLESRAGLIGVRHAVRFLGYRNGSGIVGLFNLCDCVCVPSRNEPFGIVVLEGWSAGKPVLATNAGGPSEYVCDEFNGLCITPHPDAIAGGLETLLSNPDRARQMGENGRRLVRERFTWDAAAARTLDVYGSLLPASAARRRTRKPVTQRTPQEGASRAELIGI